jgi:hypothetical protein
MMIGDSQNQRGIMNKQGAGEQEKDRETGGTTLNLTIQGLPLYRLDS